MKVRFKLSDKINNIILLVLIYSTYVPGLIGEVVFYICLCILLIQSKHNLKKDKVLLLPVMGYIVLFFIQIAWNYQGISWLIRLGGILKCVSAFSVCGLFADRYFNEFGVKAIYGYCCINNIIYIILMIMTNGSEQYIVDGVGSSNLANCICMILLPYLFSKECPIGLPAKVFYFASYVVSYIFYPASTAQMVMVIYVLMAVLIYCVRKYSIKRYGIFKRWEIVFSIFVISLVGVYIFAFNEKMNAFYNRLLYKVDLARGDLFSRFLRYTPGLSKFNVWFGIGDNRYEFVENLFEPHNLIFDMFLVFGVMGIFFLILDTFIFFVRIKNRVKLMQNIDILLSIIGLYIYFLFHPFYETSFLPKLFLVILTGYFAEKRVSCKVKRSDNLWEKEQESQIIKF